MPLPTGFEFLGALGNAAKYVTSGQLGSDVYSKTHSPNAGVVKPATRQLGNALPAQPGSLAGLINKPNSPQQLATRQPVISGVLHQAPTTPVKSITTPDGTQTTYHAQVNNTPAPTPTSTADTNATAVQARNQATQIASSNSTIAPKQYMDSNGNSTDTPTPSSNTGSSFPGIVGSLLTTSNQQSPVMTQAQQGLLSTAQPGSDYKDIKGQIAQNLEDQKKLKTNYAESFKNLDTSGLDASLATGQENVLSRTLAAKEGALASQGAGLASQLSAANQQQGVQQQGFNEAGGLANTQRQTQQSGLGTAGGLAQPIQVSPGTSVINPQNMQEGYSGIGGLTGLGVAQQNIKQGQQYTQQASDLGVALQGLNKVSGFADNFIQNSGLNQSSSPFFNKQQNTTLGQLKSSDIGTYNELVNQIQSYATQILASTGMTPTDAGSLAAKINPDGMTAPELKAFLGNLDTLGQARKAVLETAAKGSLSSGTTPYTGGTNTGGSLQSTGGSGISFLPNDKDATLQALAGGAINFGGDVMAMGGTILGYLGLK